MFLDLRERANWVYGYPLACQMSALTLEEMQEVKLVRERFLPGEMEAILTHKYFLSQKAGRDVGLDYAILDWNRHHAVKWRERRIRDDVGVQFCEMMKHKWIESQKAGRNLGKEAIVDWIFKHAEGWRKCRENDR